jgi:hypothetical protein
MYPKNVGLLFLSVDCVSISAKLGRATFRAIFSPTHPVTQKQLGPQLPRRSQPDRPAPFSVDESATPLSIAFARLDSSRYSSTFSPTVRRLFERFSSTFEHFHRFFVIFVSAIDPFVIVSTP